MRKATTALGNLSPVAERSTCDCCHRYHCRCYHHNFTCFPTQSFLDFSHFFDVDIGNESPLIIILDSGTFAISEGNIFGYNFLSWRHVGSFDAKMATCLGKTVLLQFSAAFSHVSFLYTGLRFGWSGSLMLGSLSEIGSLLQKNL